MWVKDLIFMVFTQSIPVFPFQGLIASSESITIKDAEPVPVLAAEVIFTLHASHSSILAIENGQRSIFESVSTVFAHTKHMAPLLYYLPPQNSYSSFVKF